MAAYVGGINAAIKLHADEQAARAGTQKRGA
jgi:hypothetical protein